MASRIDFARVAAAALAAAESLVREWLPDGHREGGEWKARNPTRTDASVGSFSINLDSGAWADFATGDKGGDLVALYAYLQRISQLDAARTLAQQLGVVLSAAAPHGAGSAPARSAAAPSGPRGDWEPVLPVPADAPTPPLAHIRRGKPEAMWRYLSASGELLGVVYRFRTSDGGKDVLPCCYAQRKGAAEREWRWLAFPAPRPLYGLLELAQRPQAQVLVVEGEKCVDAAREALGSTLAVVSWPGGAKAVDKADWTPLAGRKVILWPDCDAQTDRAGALLPDAQQPGVRAMERVAAILAPLRCSVRIVDIPPPGAKPAGWDVADAIAEGWTPGQLRDYLRQHLREPRSTDSSARDDQAAPDDAWQADLVRGGNGALLAVTPNAHLILLNRREWRNVLGFNEFAGRTVKHLPPPFDGGVAGDWDENDDSLAAFWLATRAGLPRLSTPMAAEAVEMTARRARFDPVRQYLDALKWDKQERLSGWLEAYLGVPMDGYSALVGRLWLVGMAWRIYEPGGKWDYMPILEGPQGAGKSSALRELAQPWFGNTDFVMGDKDSMAAIQGKWLYEVAELDSFNRSDSTRIKSFVTRQVDEFRPAYGRRMVRLPRRVVLVGTTNQHEYLKDTTGNRRFWPLQCRETIDVDGLRAMRDQLFAEAVVRVKDGERPYPTREEQIALINGQQERREIGDAWDEIIYHWLQEPSALTQRAPEQVAVSEILQSALKLDAGKITKEMSTRVGITMRKLGWERVEQRSKQPRYVYKRPQKVLPVASAAGEADDLPV